MKKPATDDHVISLYMAGLSLREVGRITDLSYQGVRYRLDAAGVRIRNRREQAAIQTRRLIEQEMLEGIRRAYEADRQRALTNAYPSPPEEPLPAIYGDEHTPERPGLLARLLRLLGVRHG